MTGDGGAAAGKRVLVAEDEYFIAKGLARHLGAIGVEVVGPVATIAGALGLVQDGRLDGAVLDVNLRGELVFPVADALMSRAVPFIFVTGYGHDAIPERFSAIARCEKPAEPRAYIARLFGQSA